MQVDVTAIKVLIRSPECGWGTSWPGMAVSICSISGHIHIPFAGKRRLSHLLWTVDTRPQNIHIQPCLRQYAPAGFHQTRPIVRPEAEPWIRVRSYPVQ
jgi:hypothetical protein